MRALILWVLIVSWTGLLSGCSDKPYAPPAKLGTNLWPGYEPFYLALELGILQPSQVQLVDYPSASEVIRGFRNGALDAAALTLDEVLLLAQNNIPVKVVLVLDISHGGDVIMARPEIERFEDLAGKRVGVESNALGAYVITRALELNGMSLADMRIERIAVSGHEEAYREGRVDAVVTFEPVRTALARDGAREIFSSQAIPGEIVDVLVVHEDYLKRHRDRVAAMADSWFEALAYIRAQRPEAHRLIAERLKLTPAEVSASYEGLILADRQENRRQLSGEHPMLGGVLKKLNRAMLDNRLLHRQVDTSGLISDQML